MHGERSRAVRFAATTVAFALVAFVACSRDTTDSPESALSAWVGAMNASRTDVTARRRAFELLSEPARTSLAERAARASQLSGREIAPWEMLAPGRFAMRFAFDPEALRSSVSGDHATVTARSRAGDRADVPMVRESGRWHVDLSLPAMQTIRAGGDGGT